MPPRWGSDYYKTIFLLTCCTSGAEIHEIQ
jgi:hypothetical protein